MFVLLECENFPLTEKELNGLWQDARQRTSIPDDNITMQCVSKGEIQRLNKEYRNTDTPTNILTFSYTPEGDHDIAICIEVARMEANERNIPFRDYVALLAAHAFLHVCNMDHEESEKDSAMMQEMERKILRACGFVPQGLSDVY
jgi:probable rRNA maturation factor